MKISDLTEEQKGHLVWRLDHNTGCGLLSACRIARGQCGDLNVVDVFISVGQTNRSAKILATKVKNYGKHKS